MKTMNANTTVETKTVFERFVRNKNVNVKHYYADNGLFDTKTFRPSINKANQIKLYLSVE